MVFNSYLQSKMESKKKTKAGSKSVEFQITSKRDEERIKNIIREQPKVADMLNSSITRRNNFLKAQRIANYQNEKSRLIGLESQLIGPLRYYAPSRLGKFGHESVDRK